MKQKDDTISVFVVVWKTKRFNIIEAYNDYRVAKERFHTILTWYSEDDGVIHKNVDSLKEHHPKVYLDMQQCKLDKES